MPPIIVVSPDPEIAAKLAGALASVGPVHTARDLDQLRGAALGVIDLDASAGPLALHAPAIAIVPHLELASAVALLGDSTQLAAVVAADSVEPAELIALARRVLAPDLSGVAGGRTVSVRDFRDKQRCLSELAAFVEQHPAARKHVHGIEQCLDEMLMNALYDAPVDARGESVFAGVPTRERIEMHTQHAATVQYGCDDRELVLSVRDSFGSLDRGTVLRCLHKGLHARDTVDRRVDGAGLGLFLMASAATSVSFEVVQGVATEVRCTFDLTKSAIELERLAFVAHERGDRPATRPARVIRTWRGRWRRIAVSAAVATVLGGGAIAWIELRDRWGPQFATLELASSPPGALITVDGVPRGTAPLALTDLRPGSAVAVELSLRGYRSATATAEVPARGSVERVARTLEPSPDFVRVRFTSEPPGARIRDRRGRSVTDRTYTPADVFVEAGQEQEFELVMPHHAPLAIEPFTPPRGSAVVVKGGKLAPIEAGPPSGNGGP